MGRIRGASAYVRRCISCVARAAAAGLLVNIGERKREARHPFFRVVELTDAIEDPAVWGKNFPLQFDGYRHTVDQVHTRFLAAGDVVEVQIEGYPALRNRIQWERE